MDLLLQAAPHTHRGDALDRLQRPLHLQVRQTPQALQFQGRVDALAAGGKAQLQDRVQRWIVMQDQGAPRLIRKLHQVQPLQHILRGIGDIAVPGELQNHIADVRPANAAQFHQAVDHAQGLLQRPTDVVFHFLGSRSRVFRAHGEGRIGQLRQQGQRQLAVGQKAEDERRQEDHENGHRAGDHEAAGLSGCVHEAFPVSRIRWVATSLVCFTLEPESMSAPGMLTRTPSFSPA